MVGLLASEEVLYRKGVEVGRKMGGNTLTAKVYTELFLEPSPISLEELSEKTGYSLASVSNAVRILQDVKKIRRIKHPGSKKVYVELEKDIVLTLHQHFKQVIDGGLRPMQECLPITISDIKKELKKELSKEEKERLKKKLTWYESYLEQNMIICDIFMKMEKEFKKYEYR
jgi:DNA-binding transcriptional regulator GbsR (MarR family)